MLASIYDPGSIGADVFSMGNMVETSTAKILTASERLAISNAQPLLVSETNIRSVNGNNLL